MDKFVLSLQVLQVLRMIVDEDQSVAGHQQQARTNSRHFDVPLFPLLEFTHSLRRRCQGFDYRAIFRAVHREPVVGILEVLRLSERVLDELTDAMDIIPAVPSFGSASSDQ